MDFTDTADDALFRMKLRAWLKRTIPRLGAAPVSLEAQLPRWQRWQAALFDAGYAGLGWPREYGGQDAGIIRQAIFADECDRADAPERLNGLGEGLAGPTLIEFGTPEQKQRFLLPILTGDSMWCQLFSEPGAGSDLASLRTKAVRDGNGWRISGNKVWTSRAQLADFAILLARTSDAPRHRGITYFILPMHQDGVDVRPLRHMLGEAEFNEVFLDGAYIPDELVVGPVDGGWKVARATLGFERLAIANGRVNTRRLMTDVVTLVRASGRGDDPAIRMRVAELYARTVLQRLNGQRIISSLAAGAPPGPTASTAKLFAAPLVEEIADFALTTLGLRGQADGDATSRWLRLAYQARGTSIAGGTSFIQRNIIAERVLGLPRS